MGDFYRLDNLRVPLNYSSQDIKQAVSFKLGLSSTDLGELKILSEGLDARGKPTHVLSVVFKCEVENLSLPLWELPASLTVPVIPLSTSKGLNPVIIGAGPAGLSAAWIMVRAGLRPLIIEQGLRIEDRRTAHSLFRKNREMVDGGSLLYGEGGAGTFSDGKLVTRRNDPLLRAFFELLISNGAPKSIAIKTHPHLGTDVLQVIIPKIRKHLESMGARFLWKTKLLNIKSKKDNKYELMLSNGEVSASDIFLGMGGSSEDLLPIIEELGVSILSRPLQIGMRMEQRSQDIARARYGKWTENAPPAEYNFAAGSIHTFCMCPGGEIVCSSGESDSLILNGMSLSRRNGKFSNSALITSLSFNNWRDAIEFRKDIENKCFTAGGKDFSSPGQTIKGFLSDKILDFGDSSYKLGVTPVMLKDLFPKNISSIFKNELPKLSKFLKGVEDGLLLAPETRIAPPWKILRDSEGVIAPHIYAIGEGSGYSSGISTSAMDGIRIALSYVKSKSSPNSRTL
jgi:uncharacterized protein